MFPLPRAPVSHTKQMVRFVFVISIFSKKIDVLILIYLTNNNFLLQIMVLRREPKPVDRFIETHM
jgi:hypothetical protein